MIGHQVAEKDLVDLFQPAEGSVNFYYGKIGNGKTYAATADILDHLNSGRVVYCNWRINWTGFDQRFSMPHRIMHAIFNKKRYFRFRGENLRFFSPDDVDIDFLAAITDAEVFIDEGQWVFDSYEGARFSKEKRRLILHTRHLNRSLNIISQRTQAIQISARGQVNRFFKCEKKLSHPFLIFRRTEYQDMKNDDVDETSEPVSVKTYFANRKVLEAYNTKYLRDGIPVSQKVEFEAYDLSLRERWELLFGLYDDRPAIEAGRRLAGAAADALHPTPDLVDARQRLVSLLNGLAHKKANVMRQSPFKLDLRGAQLSHQLFPSFSPMYTVRLSYVSRLDNGYTSARGGTRVHNRAGRLINARRGI